MSILKIDPAEFEAEEQVETEAGFHFRFAHKHKGLKIKGDSIAVTIGHDNQVLTYQNHPYPDGQDSGQGSGDVQTEKLDSESGDFVLSEEQAYLKAYDSAKLSASPSVQKIEKKFQNISGKLRPVYEIQFSAPVDKKWSWQVDVDAETGDIVDSESIALDEKPELPQFVPIPVFVFDPNPTIRSGHIYGTVNGFVDNKNSNSDFFNSALYYTQLETTFYHGTYSLQNRYAKITDQELPKNPACITPSASLMFPRAHPCFDGINALYHVTQSLRYVNETLKISAHPIVYSGPLHVDPAGLGGDDNSHYLPLTDEIAFGVGGIHDAQDHDVVLHELAHAIHNWVTHGHFSNKEGLGEGIGDYWAASYSRTKMQKNNPAYNWTFSFDGHNEYWDGRVVNLKLKYPAATQGGRAEIHKAGEIWATVCMAIWDKIGKLATDRILWSGVAMLDENSNQLDAAKALYAAAKALYPKDLKLQQTVKTTFQSYGYAIR